MKEETKGMITKPEVKFWFAILAIIVPAIIAFVTLQSRVLAVENENDRLVTNFTAHMERITVQLEDISDKINKGNVEQAEMKKDIEFIRNTLEK